MTTTSPNILEIACSPSLCSKYVSAEKAFKTIPVVARLAVLQASGMSQTLTGDLYDRKGIPIRYNVTVKFAILDGDPVVIVDDNSCIEETQRIASIASNRITFRFGSFIDIK